LGSPISRPYAQIKFSDDSRLILQPNTTLTIDKFSYDAAKPEADNAAFALIQGASVTVQYHEPSAAAIAARSDAPLVAAIRP
jgi:hypothetical protein